MATWRDLRKSLPTRPGAAPYLRRNLAEMAAIRWLVYHHTNTGPSRPTARQVAEYQVGPTAHLPFPAIAYAVYVESDGTIEWCQDLEAVTWSQGDGSPTVRFGVGSQNWEGFAVAFSGNDPTEAQIASLKLVGDTVDDALGRHLERVGHCDVSRSAEGQPLTSCPGALWSTWRPRIL